MADADEAVPFPMLARERGDNLQSLPVVQLAAVARFTRMVLAVTVDGFEPRGACVQALDLTMHDQIERVALLLECGELDARRAWVQNQNHICHDVTPRSSRLRAAPARRAPPPHRRRAA